MKKYISPLLLSFFCISFLMAQPTGFDALKLSQTDIVGSARYMGMAGAFGALGGDPSAVKSNPGGLGVYRSSDISVSFNIQNQVSYANWDGRESGTSMFKLGFSDLSYVIALPTYKSRSGSSSGLLQSNFNFSYNRLKNFNRNSSVRTNASAASMTDFMANFSKGVDASYLQEDYVEDIESWVPFLSYMAYQGYLINPIAGETDNWKSILAPEENVAPEYFIREKGYMDEYTFSWGGNISNKVFFGASVGIQTIDYSKTSRYNENLRNDQYFRLENTLRTSGAGFNFNIGVIARPVDFMRIGMAYRTPTVFSLRDSSTGDLTSSVIHENAFKNTQIGTLRMDFDYRMRTPGQWSGSLGFILGKRGIISTDVLYTHYPNMQFADDSGDTYYYEDENQSIKNIAKGGFTFKLGGEYRVTDNFFVRAGAALATPVNNADAHLLLRDNVTRTDLEYFHHKGTSYFTAGLGYRGEYFYFDAAIVNKNVIQEFYPYNLLEVIPATTTIHNVDLVTTMGFRF